MELISTFATIGFILPLFVAVLCMILARRDFLIAVTWGGGVLLSLLIAMLIRHLLRLEPSLPHFPSGHVTLAVAFYGGLLVIFCGGRTADRGVGLPVVGLFLAGIALLEGWSRVTLTHHTWLDVGGGLFVGTVGLLATGCPWTYRHASRGLRLWLVATLLVAGPLAFIGVGWLDGVIRRMVAI